MQPERIGWEVGPQKKQDTCSPVALGFVVVTTEGNQSSHSVSHHSHLSFLIL